MDRAQKEDRRNGAIGCLVIVVLGLGWCGLCRSTSSAPETRGEAASAPDPAPKAEPCEGLNLTTLVPDFPTLLCGDGGEASAQISMRNAQGDEVRTLPAGTPIRIVVGETIKRGPGHMDALVCIPSGPSAGVVGYVRNTAFFAKTCPAP